MNLVERLRDKSLVISHIERDKIADRIESLEQLVKEMAEAMNKLDGYGTVITVAQWMPIYDALSHYREVYGGEK